MKVLDLQCVHAHGFEGWFASQDDFQDQLSRGLLTCPLCGSPDVRKQLSAPRLNLHTGRGEGREPAPAPAADTLAQPAQDGSAMTPQQWQAAWLQMTRHVLAHTEDVGDRFAHEARRMHHGEIEPRHIRGQATAEETEALLDEGVAVLPLVLPEALKGPVQ